MSDPGRPDLYWREVVRSGFSGFQPSGAASTDDEFRAHVEKLHEDERAHIRSLAGRDPADPELRAAGLGLYVLAVALLTWGRLDVVEDILTHVPGGRHPARILARSVNFLVPLDAGFDAVDRPLETLEWIRRHRDLLRWDPDRGMFVKEPAG